MNKIPKELLYTQTHEWIRLEEDNTAVVGITDHAQSLLGELVFVELPDLEIDIHASDDICVVESVKAASDVYSPLTGKIIAVNEDLEEAPSLVNKDPYGDGWLFKVAYTDKSEIKDLLDADSYASVMEEEEAE